MIQVIQDYENTQSTLIAQLFFIISLNPSHWVTNETGGRDETLCMRAVWKFIEKKCAISYYIFVQYF